MDDSGETTYETPTLLCFDLKLHLYLCLLVNETGIKVIDLPHQAVVDSYNLTQYSGSWCPGAGVSNTRMY